MRPHVLENRVSRLSGCEFISRSSMADGPNEILSFSIRTRESESVIPILSDQEEQSNAAGGMCASLASLSEIEAPEPPLGTEESSDARTTSSLGFVPQRCPVPGGLCRILHQMGYIPQDETQEEILFSLRSFATQRTVPCGASQTSSDLSEDSSSDSSDGLLQTEHENPSDQGSEGETPGSDGEMLPPSNLSNRSLCDPTDVAEGASASSDQESLPLRGLGPIESPPQQRHSRVDQNTQTGSDQGPADGSATVRSPQSDGRSICFLCYGALDQPPPIDLGVYTGLDLMEKMVILPASHCAMPCCHKEAHVPCVSRLFHRCTNWICPECNTVLVQDLFGPAEKIYTYETPNHEKMDMCVIRCMVEDLRRAHPTVLSDQNIVYHFRTGTFSLSTMLSTQHI